MLKCPAAFREYNSIVVSLAVDEEAPRWCQDNIGKTVIDSSSHDVADNEVEQERRNAVGQLYTVRRVPDRKRSRIIIKIKKHSTSRCTDLDKVASTEMWNKQCSEKITREDVYWTLHIHFYFTYLINLINAFNLLFRAARISSRETVRLAPHVAGVHGRDSFAVFISKHKSEQK
ncbi:hypothetical protein RB195_021862 [Necator americanus]|uniref:Uncharacterized protein n=1 Tax=Necator americanus TaxID=51031 RepID=A0ABR1ECY8_NECAM